MPGRRALSACQGCGLEAPEADGPAHAYIGASAGCWALYGELLAQGYAGAFELQLAVDAYAVQHPGEPGRRSAQSVWLHLTTLDDVFARGLDPALGRATHARMAGAAYEWLEPPDDRGRLTVADVLAGQATVREWAHAVWAAWSAHHTAVRRRSSASPAQPAR